MTASIRTLVLLAPLAMPLIHGPAIAQALAPAETTRMLQRTVSVSATGSAAAIPDIAHITTGVQSEAATARDAMAANTAQMSKLIDGLKAAGLDAKDIHTTSVGINPRYTQPRDGKPPSISGYVAQNQVRITVHDLKKLGELLDTALSLGATQMGGISFDVSRAEILRDDARKAAMANARRRAELYATAAGATLGEVIAISEDEPSVPRGPVFAARAAPMAAGPVPVEAGSMQLESSISVTWALK